MGSVPTDPVQSRPRCVSPTPYAPLLHAWAEAGYVVAVPTYAPPTDADTDENGQIVVDLGERVTDASFVIDRMLDRVQGGFGSIVDRNHIAAAGHALGATTTYVLAFSTEGQRPARYEPRSRSGARSPATPAGYFTGVDTPLLAIHGDADTTDPIEGATEIYALANPPKFFVTLLGADRQQSVRDRRRSGVASGRGDHARLLHRVPSRSGEWARNSSRRDGKVAEVAKIKSTFR